MIEPVQSETGPFFDFSDRAKFRVRGPDALRFLNGQITNDLRKASELDAIEACVLNTKGKINAHLFISAASDAYHLDADAALREMLPARLDRYIIADDVEIEDISDQFGIFHLPGATAPVLPNEWRLTRARRFTDPGWDVWVKIEERDLARDFFSVRFRLCDTTCAENVRIESGIPRWGRELTEEIIPIEANLEERCVDYSKGCYIGQEVISRIKVSGQTNKRLCGLVALNETPLTSGMRLSSISDESREVGWITSTNHSRRLGKEIGLGFVKRGFNGPGTKLRASLAEGSPPSSPVIHVEIVPLPFI
jgi:tRNA-modifying protein YgfZ